MWLDTHGKLCISAKKSSLVFRAFYRRRFFVFLVREFVKYFFVKLSISMSIATSFRKSKLDSVFRWSLMNCAERFELKTASPLAVESKLATRRAKCSCLYMVVANEQNPIVPCVAGRSISDQFTRTKLSYDWLSFELIRTKNQVNSTKTVSTRVSQFTPIYQFIYVFLLAQIGTTVVICLLCATDIYHEVNKQADEQTYVRTNK